MLIRSVFRCLLLWNSRGPAPAMLLLIELFVTFIMVGRVRYWLPHPRGLAPVVLSTIELFVT